MFTKKSFLVKVEKAALKTKSEHSNSNTLLFIRGLGGSSLLLAAALLLLLSLPAFAQDDPDVVWVKELGVKINCVKFSPDSRYLAVAADYRNPKLFDVETGDLIREFIGGGTNTLDFTDDGSLLASAGYNDYINIYSVETGDELKKIDLNEDSVYVTSIDISHNGELLAAVFKSGTNRYLIKIWNLISNEIIYQSNYQYISKVVFSPDDQHFVICQTYPYPESKTNYIYVFSTNPMKNEGILGSHDYAIADICFSHDGKYLASAAGDVKIWDFEKRELKQTITKKDTGFGSIAYSMDDNFLVMGFLFYRDVFIYDINNTEYVYHLNSVKGTPLSLDVSSDNQYIGSGYGYRVLLLNAKWVPSIIEEPFNENNSIIYPNPITNEAVISFNLPHNGITNIDLNNINGQLVKKVFEGYLEAGLNTMNINADGLSSGTYFCNISCSDFFKTIKIIVKR